MKSFRVLVELPDYITLASVICGVLSIFASINKSFDMATIFLVVAVIFDRLDGKIARLLGRREKEFGKEIDSLSDAISFGAAPAVLGYTLGLHSFYAIIILLFFICAGLLRLARFNVIKTEQGYYQGMNIAYNGLIFPLLYFIRNLFSISGIWKFNILLAAYLIAGFLMLSSIKWKRI